MLVVGESFFTCIPLKNLGILVTRQTKTQAHFNDTQKLTKSKKTTDTPFSVLCKKQPMHADLAIFSKHFTER